MARKYRRGRKYRGFLSLRSRARPFGATGRSLSSAAAANPGTGGDTIKCMSFKHGRGVAKPNKRTILRLTKSLTPINTHLINEEGFTQQDEAGVAKWKLFSAGTPSDIRNMILKGYQAGINVPGTAAYKEIAAAAVTGAMPYIQDALSWEGRLQVYSYDVQMVLKNSAAIAVDIQVYECVARDNIVLTSSIASLDDILNSGFDRQYPSAQGRMDKAKEDSTLYMNPWWCHYFNIVKVRNVHLNAGEVCKINLTHGKPRTINPLTMGGDPTYLAWRNFTRCLVTKQTGDLVHVTYTIAGVPPTLQEGIDTAGTQVDYRLLKKFRWNNLAPSNAVITSQEWRAPSGVVAGTQTALDPKDGNLTTNVMT